MIIKGTAASETLKGTSAADILNGMGGSDTINAGSGNDKINFTTDATGTKIRGDSGYDTIVFKGSYFEANYGISQISGIEAIKFDSTYDDITTGKIEYTVPTSLTGIATPSLFKDVTGGDGLDYLTIHVTGGMKGAIGIKVPDVNLNNWYTASTNYSQFPTDEFALVADDSHDYTLYASEAVGASGVMQFLITGSGNDTIYGSAYDDFMFAQNGVNHLYGKGGNDTFQLRYTDVLSPDSVYDGGPGTDFLRIRGDVTFTGHLVSVEAVFFRSGQYTLVGGGTSYSSDYPGRFFITASQMASLPTNLKLAGYGELYVNDAVNFSAAKFQFLGSAEVSIKISGTSAANSLTGSSVDDFLVGFAGADRLSGGAGEDILSGGLGKDTLTGGTAADWFFFDTAPNSTTNRDVITDMHTAEGDKIKFSSAVFTGFGSASGVLADEFYAAAGATKAHDASDRLIYDTSTGVLYYDADGLGGRAAVAVALVMGAPTLHFDDFGLMA